MQDSSPDIERTPSRRTSHATEGHWKPLAFGAALMLLGLALPAQAFAWTFSGQTCSTAIKSKQFQNTQPQVYLMLDRSGSMGGYTNTTCTTCEYSYNKGKELATRSIDFTQDGGEGTVRFGERECSSVKTDLSKTKSFNGGGDTLNFRFRGLTANSSSSVPIKIEVEGDFNSDEEDIRVEADGSYEDTVCDGGDGCSQCPGSFQNTTAYISSSHLRDGRLNLELRTDDWVGDFCSSDRIKVTIPDRYAGSSCSTATPIGEAGRKTNINNDYKYRDYFDEYGFNSDPYVFATTQTENGGQDPSAAHVERIGQNSFVTQHCEYDGYGYCDNHNQETNGWIAIDPQAVNDASGMDAGTVWIDGDHNRGNHEYVNFSGDINNDPLLFTQIITENGGDNPLNSQALNVDSNGGKVEFCEQEDENDCDGHTNEKMAWWAIDPQTATKSPGMDWGTFWTDDNHWERINFNKNFSEKPVVIADVQTENGGSEALYPEVKDVDKNSALIRFCESEAGGDYDDQNDCDYSHSNEEMAWIAVEPGKISMGGSGGGGQPVSKTKTIQHDSDNLDFNFSGVSASGSSVSVKIDVKGDFNSSYSEEIDVYADGDYMGEVCDGSDGCSQCSSSYENTTISVPASKFNDGQIEIETNTEYGVDDFCSTNKIRVTIPNQGSSTSSYGIQSETIGDNGDNMYFDFSGMQTTSESHVPVTVKFSGDFNRYSEEMDIYADGSYQTELCSSSYDCNQCPSGYETRTVNVPMSKIRDGQLSMRVNTTHDVDDFCGTNEVKILIPDRFFGSGGGTSLPDSSCMSTEYKIWGDYNWDQEYADLMLDGQKQSRLCDGNNCGCGGPYKRRHSVQDKMTENDKLTATVKNSRYVDHNICRPNKAEVTLYDHEQGGSGSTYTGEFDCPTCSTDADCQNKLSQLSSVKACAINDATFKQKTCRAQKWTVAENSVNAIVSDMTKSDPDDAEFGLGLFNYSAWNEVTPQENAASKIKSALSSNSPWGGTDMRDAANKSNDILDQAGSDRVQASMMITDGIHGGDETDVIRAACKHRRERGKLYVVGFSSGTDPNFNNAVAAAGGTGTCCEPGHSGCSASSQYYVDPCQLSNGQLHNYNDGRQLECSGSYNADNRVSLQNAISSIASDLSCTVDVSNLGNHNWDDPYYDCAPEYDCFKVEVPGTSKRIHHVNSSQSPKGWKWSNSSRQNSIILTDKWCTKVRDKLSNKTVNVTRACMCTQAKNGTCDYTKRRTPGQCTCTKGSWTCRQGISDCAQQSFSSCPDGELKGEGNSCTVGQGVCKNTGQTVCKTAGGSPSCNAEPDTSAKGPEVCDGKDNDCDGSVDEGVTRECGQSTGICQTGTETCSNGSWSGTCQGNVSPQPPETCDGRDEDCDGAVDEDVEPRTCYTGRAGTAGVGICEKGQTFCTGGTFGSCQGETTPQQEVCNGKDDDCDGKVDEGTGGASCDDTGKPGRCSDGKEVCVNGSLECQPTRSPMPEMCNGLDDDCDGEVDNISESWSQNWNVSANNTSRTCSQQSACQCDAGDADDQHRGTKTGNTKQEEFDEMVNNTQTDCECGAF